MTALCPTCNGSGEIGENRPGQPTREHYGQPVTRDCPACGGTGRR